MALEKRSTAPLRFSRLVSAWVCLCAFALLPLPPIAGMTSVIPPEAERSLEADGEISEEQLVVTASVRRRVCHRRPNLRWACETGDPSHRIGVCDRRQPAIVGHHFFNGLRAPLVI
ncbi:MAG: hypothetical protein ACC628_10345 [Pirellulaceae bacterium]